MGYLFLILTILFETAAIIFMKLSAGFQNRSWALAAFITYLLSFIFLTLSLKQMPAGIANALWAGTSTILVTVSGIFIFKEQLNMAQVIFLLLIVIGLAGLHLTKSI
jgi:small multidrug resistance pump